MKVSGSAPKIEVTQLQMEELASTTSKKKKKKHTENFIKNGRVEQRIQKTQVTIHLTDILR